ncbi:Small nuclear ribonucleoprotein E [Lemmus lemmus]
MVYRGQGQKVQKVMVQPINLIFRYLLVKQVSDSGLAV